MLFSSVVFFFIYCTFSDLRSDPGLCIAFSSHISYSSVQLLSHALLFATPWAVPHQASLSITNSQSLLKLMSILSVIQLPHPLLSPSPPAFNLSSIRLFSNESVLHTTWPNYWSFSFSVSPLNEQSGWISFKIDWFDLLAVQ